MIAAEAQMKISATLKQIKLALHMQVTFFHFQWITDIKFADITLQQANRDYMEPREKNADSFCSLRGLKKLVIKGRLWKKWFWTEESDLSMAVFIM